MGRITGLRRKLIPIALLLLALPWLGWQTLTTIDQLAGESETQALRLVGQSLARQLAQSESSFNAPGSTQPLVPSINFQLQIDGFLDEWPQNSPVYSNDQVTVRFAQNLGRVYGVIQSSDAASQRWTFSWIDHPTTAQIELATRGQFRAQARVVRDNRRETIAVKRWDKGEGYRLEFEAPKYALPNAGRVQLSSDAGVSVQFDLGLHSVALLRPAMALSDQRQITVYNSKGQQLAATPTLAGPAQLSVTTPVFGQQGTVGTIELRGPLSQAIQQSKTALWTLVAQVSVLVVLLVGSLVWFSTGLSRRILRLQQELAQQLNRPSLIASDIQFSGTEQNDEIGQLSQEMQRLLTELARYNQFLVRIPRTLRHELANPMSTIQSSLELLEDETDPAHQARLRASAIRGIDKLNNTLTQITEAANLEESLANDSIYPINLHELLREYFEVCVQAHPSFDWQLRLPDAAAWVQGSELRVEQMLDKLVDNAVGFTPFGGRIEVRLINHAFSADIQVWNEGSQVPLSNDVAPFQLFSGTRNDSEGTHLGLGLFVVQQIALAMGGQAVIQNQDGGVVVGAIDVPLMDAVPQR